MDLYALLGVTRTASNVEIERAYRRLARRYHPGLNPGDRVAEQAYQQIQDAYQVLTDVNRRREYDRGGGFASPAQAIEASVAFAGFDFTAPAEGPLAATFSELFADVFQQAAREATNGSSALDLGIDVGVSFSDAIRGADVPVSVTRQVWCQACAGQGRHLRAAVACPECQGQGQRRWARGHMVFTKPCEACNGHGRLETQPCRGCRGAGVVPRTEVVTVRVPPGVEDGARISIPGRGHAGLPGESAGDLYVRVAVADHPYFQRRGRDLHVVVPVGVHEAALGAEVDAPSLDGPVRLRIPQGTTPGQTLRVPGHGVRRGPGDTEAGDLVVEVQLVLPATLDERSQVLLREFGDRNDVAAMRRAYFDRTEPRN